MQIIQRYGGLVVYGPRFITWLTLLAFATILMACGGEEPKAPPTQTTAIAPASSASRATIVAAQSTIEFADTVAANLATANVQLAQVTSTADTTKPEVTPLTSSLSPTPTPTTIPPKIDIYVNELAHIPGSGSEENLIHLGSGLIDKDGDYVYLLSSVEGLKIVSVKDPFAPMIVAVYDDLHDPWNLEVDGGVAYIGDGSGITMLDISDPSNPRRIGRLRTDLGGTIRLWNQRLYFGGGQRIEVFDISNPDEPEKLYDMDMIERVNGIQIDSEKERLFVFMGDDLLQVFDANYLDSYHLQQPVNVSYGNDYLMQNLMLYETTTGLLQVFSAEEANHLELVGTYGESKYQSGYEQVDEIEGIKVQDGLAYIADYRNGLYIIDVSTPERMYVRGFYHPGELWWARDVEIEGDLVYLVSDDGGLRVLRISGEGIHASAPVEPDEISSPKQSESSPDGLGGKIVFLSDRDQPRDLFGDVELYVMNSDGGDQRRIAPGIRFPYYSSVVVSPDGQTIAVGVVNGDAEQKGLHLFDSTGLNQGSVDTNGQGMMVFSWAIDNEILVSLHEPNTGFADLYIFEIDSRSLRQLTSSEQRLVFGDQSPSGTTVAFMQYVPNNDGNPQLWLMESDGSDKRSLITEGALSMAWSPDGKYVVYETNMPTSHLRSATIDGDDISSLTPIERNHADHEPNWSPDSQKVVYAHTDGNTPGNPVTQIHVIDRVTEKDAQLTSDGNNYDPYWVPIYGPQTETQERSPDAPEPLQGQANGDNVQDSDTLDQHIATPGGEEEIVETANAPSQGSNISSHIAFVGEDKNIWLTNQASGNKVLLSDLNGEHPKNLVWSPDGQRLAMVLSQTGSFFDCDITIIDLSTGEATKLGIPQQPGDHSAIAQLTWNSDGTELYYQASMDGLGRYWKLRKIKARPGALEEVPDISQNWQWEGFPAFSTDKLWMTYGMMKKYYLIEYPADYWGIWLAQADGKNRQRLITGMNGPSSWSPDGNYFAIATEWKAEGFGPRGIYVVNINNPSPRLLKQVQAHYAWHVAWSPDGQYIAFHDTGDDGDNEIWTIRPDGTGVHLIAEGHLASWSPDGQKMLFTTEAGTRTSEIWIIGVDGTSPRKLVDGSQPAWRPVSGDISVDTPYSLISSGG